MCQHNLENFSRARVWKIMWYYWKNQSSNNTKKYNYVTCKRTLWRALEKGEKRGDSRPPPPPPSQRVCLQANNSGNAGICDCGGSVVENSWEGRTSIVIQIAVVECRNCCLLKLGGNYQRLSNCHIFTFAFLQVLKQVADKQILCLRTSPPCSRNLWRKLNSKVVSNSNCETC